MTMRLKSHCGLCNRKLKKSNAGIGVECKDKLPDRLTVALLNRSEHSQHYAYDDPGHKKGTVSRRDVEDAFKHLGGTAQLLIFIANDQMFIDENPHTFFEGNATWDIWYKSEQGIHFIDWASQFESMENDYEKGSWNILSDKADVDMRKRVLLMCSPHTNTKIELTWVDSNLGYLMNRGHYNGPYPVGMGVEEWAREIHNRDVDSFQVCHGCDLAQIRYETIDELETEYEILRCEFDEFRFKYPELRHELYEAVTNVWMCKKTKDMAIVKGMFDDIREDELNNSVCFLGSPQWYDPTGATDRFWDCNIIQAGEIGWLNPYGNLIFAEFLLPFLLEDLSYAFDESWKAHGSYLARTPTWGESFSEYLIEVDSQDSDHEYRASVAMQHALYEIYPVERFKCTNKDCGICEN